jgi:ATP-dependent RNA helicase RhlE
VGTRIERVKLPHFDYTARATERLEVPMAQRIAEIRARKTDERARARVNAERRGTAVTVPSGRSASAPARHYARASGFRGR